MLNPFPLLLMGVIGLIALYVANQIPFSVTDNGFERLWNCFHADCHTKGGDGYKPDKR